MCFLLLEESRYKTDVLQGWKGFHSVYLYFEPDGMLKAGQKKKNFMQSSAEKVTVKRHIFLSLHIFLTHSTQKSFFTFHKIH